MKRRIFNMKMMNIAGALTIAVALATMTTSCSNDDSFVQPENTIQPQRNVAFSISATIGDEGATRAVVETSGTSHTLKFGTGDQLYVTKKVVVGGVYKYVRGMLSAEAIDTDGKSATFSGSLTLPEGFTGEFDAADAEATLIPANGEDNFVITDGDDLSSAAWKAGVSEGALDDAIAKYSFAKGKLDADGAVALLPGSAFVNCHITMPEAKCYAVAVKRGSTVIARGSATSDASGNANFVAWMETSETPQAYTVEMYYRNNKYTISLGQRAIAAKVYNATRAAGDSEYNSFEILNEDGSVYTKPDYIVNNVNPFNSGTYYIKGYTSSSPLRVDQNNVNLVLSSVAVQVSGNNDKGLEIGGTTTLTLNGESYFSGQNYSIYARKDFTVNGKGILESQIYSDADVENILVDGGATVNVPNGYLYMTNANATLTIDGGSTVYLSAALGYTGCNIPNICIKKGTFKYPVTEYLIQQNFNKINHIYGPDGTTELTTYTTDGSYRIYTVE